MAAAVPVTRHGRERSARHEFAVANGSRSAPWLDLHRAGLSYALAAFPWKQGTNCSATNVSSDVGVVLRSERGSRARM